MRRLIHGVTVNSVSGGLDSSILEISYQCSKPGSARNVIQSVIDAYAEHLTEQHANVGKETLDLIKDVRGEVGEKLANLEASYDEFKKRSPLIYRNGERTSIHRENADQFFIEKQSLLVRRARLESKLRATKEAIDANDPPAAILLMLQESSDGVSEMTEGSTGPAKFVETIRMSRADEAREQQLVPLQLREQELLNQYGFGHPSVKQIQSQIAVTKGLIEEIEKNERQLQQEIQKAQKPSWICSCSRTPAKTSPSRLTCTLWPCSSSSKH